MDIGELILSHLKHFTDVNLVTGIGDLGVGIHVQNKSESALLSSV